MSLWRAQGKRDVRSVQREERQGAWRVQLQRHLQLQRRLRHEREGDRTLSLRSSPPPPPSLPSRVVLSTLHGRGEREERGERRGGFRSEPLDSSSSRTHARNSPSQPPRFYPPACLRAYAGVCLCVSACRGLRVPCVTYLLDLHVHIDMSISISMCVQGWDVYLVSSGEKKEIC
jgi:hypothetical protein